MKDITYTIDKDLSLKESKLVVKVKEPHKGSYYLKNIPPSQWHKELKTLSTSGKFYFNDKELAVDFYGSATFYYFVEKEKNDTLKVSCKLKWSDKEIDLSKVDFLFQGPPLFFIYGIHLKIIATDISFKNLLLLKESKTCFSPSDIQKLLETHLEFPEEPAVIFEKSAKHLFDQNLEPLPFLILKDKTGAFADLWFDYQNGTKIKYQDIKPNLLKREKSYESDLLETDFILKQMANSSYYCKMDKVSKSLTFLLEIGWKIFDYKGREILRQTDFHLQMESEGSKIQLIGYLNYQDHKADLKDLVGAFTRRDRFLELSNHFVALLPEKIDQTPFNQILEASEIVSDNVYLKRETFVASLDQFDNEHISLSEDLNLLKSRLLNFSGIQNNLLDNSFQGSLRPYQQEGVNFLKFLYDYQFHGMLADDMGLGKTVQVLAFLTLVKSNQPNLIVLPASLVFNWELEIKKFTKDFKVFTYHGKNRLSDFSLSSSYDLILTTYHTLRSDIEIFERCHFNCLILDEAQTIKNIDTQVARALKQISSKFRLSITGTPIENNLKELYSHFHFLNKDLFGDEKEFMKMAEASLSDSRYLDKIKKMIRPFILRRKKEEVAKDLPEKIEQTVFVQMEPKEREIYESTLRDSRQNLIKKIELDGLSKHRMEVLELILRLRQICCHPILAHQSEDLTELKSSKLEALLQDIETVVLEGKKVLVYSQFTSMLKIISKALNEKGFRYVYLDGNTVQRESVVQEFQTNPNIPIFLISLKAGGVGLNLTSADYVFLYDPWWNDAVENQAIHRAHRIGRKETVIAKRYITEESIEEKMMSLKNLKSKLVQDFLSEELSNASLTEDDFKFLIDF